MPKKKSAPTRAALSAGPSAVVPSTRAVASSAAPAGASGGSAAAQRRRASAPTAKSAAKIAVVAAKTPSTSKKGDSSQRPASARRTGVAASPRAAVAAAEAAEADLAAFRKELEEASAAASAIPANDGNGGPGLSSTAAAAAAAAAAPLPPPPRFQSNRNPRRKPTKADKGKRKQGEHSTDHDSLAPLDSRDVDDDDSCDLLADPLNGSPRSRCMDHLVSVADFPSDRATAALDATAVRVRDRERQRRHSALARGDRSIPDSDDGSDAEMKDPTDATLWCEAAHGWLEDQEEMLDLREAMEASLREAEREREKKLKEGGDPFDLVGSGGNGGGGESSAAAAAAAAAASTSPASAAPPQLPLPRGSAVVKILQKRMGEAPSSSSASRFEALFTPREAPRAALARLLGRERDARKWFGGCAGTNVFLEELTQRLAKGLVKSKAFAAAAFPASPPPVAAVAEAASAELVALIETATTELSSVLFSMPSVGGGVPEAFTRLVPVNLDEEEDEDEEVVVVMSAPHDGGGGRGGGNGRAGAVGNNIPPPVFV